MVISPTPPISLSVFLYTENGTLSVSWPPSLCAAGYLLTINNCSGTFEGPFQFTAFQRSLGPNETSAIVQLPQRESGACVMVQTVDSIGRVSVPLDGPCLCGSKCLLLIIAITVIQVT